MLKTGVLGIFLLINAVAIFCAFNPWVPDWQRAGISVLVIEGAFFLLIGLPLFLYHLIWKRKSFKQGLSDSTNTVMDLISYFG